jgi:hypothetical protein
MRLTYLKQASKSVCIDNSANIVLRAAIWAYCMPILSLVVALFFGATVINETNHVRVAIYGMICLLSFCGGVYLFYCQWTSRVAIFADKLIYSEASEHWEIPANDIDKVQYGNFSVLIKKRSSDKYIKIPTTFRCSEAILSFINQAVSRKVEMT